MNQLVVDSFNKGPVMRTICVSFDDEVKKNWVADDLGRTKAHVASL